MLWIPGYFCLWPRKTLQSNENIPSDRGAHRWQVGRCGGRIRPKIFRRLKFPKTPFSHLWGALLRAFFEFSISIRISKCIIKCGIGLFFQNTFPPEEKVDWLNLSFYDHFTRLLCRLAPRIHSGAGFVHRAVDPKLLQALFYPASHDSCWSQAPKKKYWNRSISFHTRICLYVSCP